MKIIAWADSDPRGQLALALAPFKEELDVVNVDSIGIGYYLARHLEDLGYPVQDVNVSLPAEDDERFNSQKAEVYWSFRDILESGDLRGLTDEQTISQLSTCRWRPDSRGRISVIGKKEMISNGIKSPDRAESVILAFVPKREVFQNQWPVSTSYRTL